MEIYNILSLNFPTLFKFFFKVIPAFYLAMIVWWIFIGIFLLVVLTIGEMFIGAPTMGGKQVIFETIKLLWI